MRRSLIAMALLGASIVPPPAGASEEILRALLPVPGLEIAAMDTPEQVGGELRVGNVTARVPGVSISIDEIRIQPSPGRIDVRFDRLLWRSDDTEGVDIITSGTLVFTGLPAATGRADPVCALAASLTEAQLGRTVIEWGERRGGASLVGAARSQIASLSLSASPDLAACAFQGRIDLGEATTILPGGNRIETRGVTLTAEVPLDLDTARQASGTARLALAVDRLESVSGGEVPSFGAARIVLGMEAAAQRSAGLVFLLRAMAAEKAAHPLEQRAMEAWNALHLLSPEVSQEVAGMRLFLPGIVPPGLVANFRRAGLSNARGDLAVQISLTNDRAALQARTSLTGVFDLSLAAAASTSRIPPEIMRTTLSDPDASPWSISALHLDQARIDYRDTGMEHVVEGLFGVPAGRLVEEIRALVRRDGGADPLVDQFAEGLAYFLRLASGGASMQARFAPIDGARIDLPRDFHGWTSLGSDPQRTVAVEFESR